MQKALPVHPISQLQQRPSDLLSMITQGPVILAQRSTAAAVLVSIEEWNAIADQLAERRFTQRQVEAIIEAYRRRNSNEPTVSSEELDAMIAERYGHVASTV